MGRAARLAGLHLDGKTGFVATAPAGEALREKTLEAWVDWPTGPGAAAASSACRRSTAISSTPSSSANSRRAAGWPAATSSAARSAFDGPEEKEATKRLVHVAHHLPRRRHHHRLPRRQALRQAPTGGERAVVRGGQGAGGVRPAARHRPAATGCWPAPSAGRGCTTAPERRRRWPRRPACRSIRDGGDPVAPERRTARRDTKRLLAEQRDCRGGERNSSRRWPGEDVRRRRPRSRRRRTCCPRQRHVEGRGGSRGGARRRWLARLGPTKLDSPTRPEAAAAGWPWRSGSATRRTRCSPASSSTACGTITSASAWSTRRATSASTAAGPATPSCSTGWPSEFVAQRLRA